MIYISGTVNCPEVFHCDRGFQSCQLNCNIWVERVSRVELLNFTLIALHCSADVFLQSLELKPANATFVVGIKGYGTYASDSLVALLLLMSCQRPEKESDPSHRAQVCELFVLTWPYAAAVCEWICAVNHIKAQRRAQLLRPLTLACSETQGGWWRRSARHTQT